MVDLPEQFGELEGWARNWAIQSQNERWRKRLESDFKDLREFYDAVLPRVGEILEYLNKIPASAWSDADYRLLHLALSFAEVAHAVEKYGQPGVIDSFPPSRFLQIKSRFQ
ncbi:MAG: hypothetical protein IVW54_02730 [Candidatus Binataceae bacterium]|nr:hypothetical protein [Candidatus Binataceae bacterium]